MQWNPPLIRHYTNMWPCYRTWRITELPNLTFCRIARGFHITFPTRLLTPPDTWSCSIFGLVCVLMWRQVSQKLVLFRYIRVSNSPRYFCFTSCWPYPSFAQACFCCNLSVAFFHGHSTALDSQSLPCPLYGLRMIIMMNWFALWPLYRPLNEYGS